MKLNNKLNKKTLHPLTAALAIMAAAPSAQAEEITDAQRDCVQRVLKNSNADTSDIKACVAAEAGSDDPDNAKKVLAPDSMEAQTLFAALEARFSQEAPYRPDVVKFTDVKKALEARPDLLFSLNQMEKTGGAPDVIAVEGDTFVFADVSEESPEGRRGLTYDQAKKMADKMGVEMMDERTYRKLLEHTHIDFNSWSLLLTDAKTRAFGFTLDGIHGTDGVYVDRSDTRYHSLYRGWRALLRVPKP